MTYRLTHIARGCLTVDGQHREPVEYLNSVMEVGEKAAKQQLAFYLQGWVEEDPDNRRVQQRNGMNGWCLERPANCTCEVCTRLVPESPRYGEQREWWWFGSRGEHRSSRVHLVRLDAPTTRAAAPTWRVVRRPSAAPHVAPGTVSEHYTKLEAQRGLSRAVYDWRNGRQLTAIASGSDYLLKRNSVAVFRLSIERIS